MKRLLLIIISFAILTGCSTNSSTEQRSKDSIIKIEITKYGYEIKNSIENQKVLNITILENPGDIKSFMSLFNQRSEAKPDSNILPPFGSISITNSNGTKLSYDLWSDENSCLVYDKQSKQYSKITSDNGIKLLYKILKKVDPKYL